ncbi:hypothetical protein ACE2AJ_09050 [Aquihabitans daechungensis]|uniref:hypothetical protein n=1 Tax=Aquihabitans daechungensis TaxID=1052257 RepID=UPI003B9DDBF9
MSDAPTSDSTPEPMPPAPGPAAEIAVDPTAFLPEGVELAADSDVDVPAADPGVDAPAADPGVDATAGEAPASAVDLEALSQIERDLDAVDAAIAALDAGTYGIDPATGRPIDDALLAEDPTRLS